MDVPAILLSSRVAFFLFHSLSLHPKKSKKKHAGKHAGIQVDVVRDIHPPAWRFDMLASVDMTRDIHLLSWGFELLTSDHVRHDR